MSVVLTKYQSKITGSIRAAQTHGAVTKREADCLCSMAINSFPAASTTALIHRDGAPDYLYASLYFATLVWQSGDADNTGKTRPRRVLGVIFAPGILRRTPGIVAGHDCACGVADCPGELLLRALPGFRYPPKVKWPESHTIVSGHTRLLLFGNEPGHHI
jgi:hypothetical protein